MIAATYRSRIILLRRKQWRDWREIQDILVSRPLRAPAIIDCRSSLFIFESWTAGKERQCQLAVRRYFFFDKERRPTAFFSSLYHDLVLSSNKIASVVKLFCLLWGLRFFTFLRRHHSSCCIDIFYHHVKKKRRFFVWFVDDPACKRLASVFSTWRGSRIKYTTSISRYLRCFVFQDSLVVRHFSGDRLRTLFKSVRRALLLDFMPSVCSFHCLLPSNIDRSSSWHNSWQLFEEYLCLF